MINSSDCAPSLADLACGSHERYANALFFAPYDMSVTAERLALDVQLKRFWNADGADDLQRRAGI